MTNAEFDVLLNDPSKTIEGDISWSQSEDHPTWVRFQAEVASEVGWPLFIVGSYNPLLPALSFALILKSAGRVYALDMGKDHHNPECSQIGELHKHRWDAALRDKHAYVPEDITKSLSDVEGVWEQFCEEVRLNHDGLLSAPPPIPADLFT